MQDKNGNGLYMKKFSDRVSSMKTWNFSPFGNLFCKHKQFNPVSNLNDFGLRTILHFCLINRIRLKCSAHCLPKFFSEIDFQIQSFGESKILLLNSTLWFTDSCWSHSDVHILLCSTSRNFATQAASKILEGFLTSTWISNQFQIIICILATALFQTSQCIYSILTSRLDFWKYLLLWNTKSTICYRAPKPLPVPLTLCLMLRHKILHTRFAIEIATTFAWERTHSFSEKEKCWILIFSIPFYSV